MLHSPAAEGLCHPQLPGFSALQDLHPAALQSLLMHALCMQAVAVQCHTICTALHCNLHVHSGTSLASAWHLPGMQARLMAPCCSTTAPQARSLWPASSSRPRAARTLTLVRLPAAAWFMWAPEGSGVL